MNSKTDASTTQRTIFSSGPEQDERNTACLVVIHGEGLGHRVDVGEIPIVIGRSPDCELHIPHRSVSRNHCKIWRDRDAYRVQDMGSTNRTFLNDRPIIESELKDGDHITTGETIVKFISRTSVEARYHEELYQLATLDALTELYNRRQFRELLDKEIARASRRGRPLALMILDLDHFKPVNDTYGHVAGDAVLREVAKVLRTRVRGDDVAARIGGEEFAIILPESDTKAALVFAEDLRQGVAGLSGLLDGRLKQITVSIGVACWTSAFRNASDLLRAADTQLYRAKEGGRNQVYADGFPD